MFWFVIVIILVSIWLYSNKTAEPHVPRIGIRPGLFDWNLVAAKNEFRSRGFQLVAEAFRQKPDGIFIAQTEDTPRILLSPKYLGELHMLPETYLSHRESIVLRHVGKYTGMDVVLQSHVYADVCRVHLTRNLPQLIPVLAPTVETGLSSFLSKNLMNDSNIKPDAGVTLSAIQLSYFIISQLFSNISVGQPLCLDQSWVSATMEYPKLVNAVSAALRPWPHCLRPLISRIRPEVTALKDAQVRIRGMLDPVIEQRRASNSRSLDCLQWLLDNSGPHESDDQSIFLKLMFLTMAGIHTSAIALDHILLDLCAMPEYQDILRAEINQVLSSSNGQWDMDTTKSLSKLDSFLKESQRYNHPASLGFHKKTLKPITLSDRFIIPPGWIISMPAEVLSRSEDHYDVPDKFDGLRFWKRRQGIGKEVTTRSDRYVDVHPGNLAWGSGRSTCPGRWYADVQLKLAVAKVLTSYKLEFPTGVTARPQNLHVDEKIMPDVGAKIVFTRVK